MNKFFQTISTAETNEQRVLFKKNSSNCKKQQQQIVTQEPAGGSIAAAAVQAVQAVSQKDARVREIDGKSESENDWRISKEKCKNYNDFKRGCIGSHPL